MHTDRCGNTRGWKHRPKGSGKQTKYKSLCIEIQRMWNLKRTIVPLIIIIMKYQLATRFASPWTPPPVGGRALSAELRLCCMQQSIEREW